MIRLSLETSQHCRGNDLHIFCKRKGFGYGRHHIGTFDAHFLAGVPETLSHLGAWENFIS